MMFFSYPKANTCILYSKYREMKYFNYPKANWWFSVTRNKVVRWFSEQHLWELVWSCEFGIWILEKHLGCAWMIPKPKILDLGWKTWEMKNKTWMPRMINSDAPQNSAINSPNSILLRNAKGHLTDCVQFLKFKRYIYYMCWPIESYQSFHS